MDQEAVPDSPAGGDDKSGKHRILIETGAVKPPAIDEAQVRALVKQLRDEANSLKDCFTKNAFQAVGLGSITLGLVGRFVFENPLAGFGAIAAIVIVILTSRIGTYKYAASNRAFGFELFLDRTRDLPASGRWHPRYRLIEWEQVMQAWRVVQPTLFEAIYHRGGLMQRNSYREQFDPAKGRRGWYCQASLLRGEPEAGFKPSVYFAGTYLRTMQLLLHGIAILALSLMAAMTVLAWLQAVDMGFMNATWLKWLCTTAFVIAFVFALTRIAIDHTRRTILEDGILSIPSCALVWHATVIAHYEAMAGAKRSYGTDFTDYVDRLGQQARSLANSADDIEAWIRGPEHREVKQGTEAGRAATCT